MGNSPSNSDSEEDKDYRGMDGNGSDSEDGGEKETTNLTDLSGLLDHSSLRTLAAKIKEEIPENVLQQYKFQILRWLEENKADETLTVSQFCDWLMNKGVSRDDAYRAFQQFDTDGSGVVEVNTILETVRSSNGVNVLGELGRSIRMLQACSLTPGFVDVYAGDQNAVKQHSDKILKYLLRNRSSSMSLPFPYLNGFNNTTNMRNSVLKSTFRNIKESVHSGNGGTLSSGEEVRTISPCYSNIEVSSNTSDTYRLTNDDPNTFWQSDGSARSHWIRLHVKSNVVIKSLSISVASSDSSYMPELISIAAGKNFRSLRAIKEVRIPAHVTGDVVLLKNAKTYYPVIQINIKRCRNDGCDTRIHGLKAVGYKVIREAGISVADAAAMWYLQILASTVTVTMPLAPHLRKSILEHTKNALGHIPPLSLSPASGERPPFLSKFVLQEVEKFVTDIALYNGEVVAEGLHMLLSFNLARGNVAGLIRTLKLFQENLDTSLPCANLLLKTVQARDSCWERSGHQLTLTLCGTDGGQSDDSTLPDNVLSQSWSAPIQSSYVTEEGKTKVSMVFKSTEMMQLTRLRIRVVSGAKGPKRGLVFVYREDSKDFDLSKQIERFEGYDKWGKIEYNFSVQVREAGIAGKPDNPVAYFTFEDDCDEIDIPVSWHPVGNYVMVKFLEPRQDTATRLGISGMKFYGFTRKLALVDNEQEVSHPPNPDKKPTCSSLEIVKAVLQFLIDLSQDQAQKKTISSGKPEYLEFNDIPLDTIWELFVAFRDSDEEKWQVCADMMLKLLYCLLPVLSTVSGQCKNSAEAFFQHLGSVIDNVKEEEEESRRHRLCRQLIIDGAAVFFPDKDARRKQLFTMMQNVESLNKAPSVMLVFQSLCQFFSSVDPSGLLDLPKKPTESFDPSPVLDIMETMISVTYHEFIITLDSGHNHEQVVHLLQLVSSLQTSLLAWCWGQLAPDETTEGTKGPHEMGKAKATFVIMKYTTFVAQRATDACKLILKKQSEQLEKTVLSLESSFLGSVTRQLVLILTFLCDFCNSSTRVLLAKSFMNLNSELQNLASSLPKVFPHITSEHWANIQTEDIVLRTWEVESSHSYENNQHLTQVFTCPGADKFVVDFDPRCETERRYDYLVFTDAKAVQMRFDQKVGTSKWPKQVFFSGPHLHFLFHSDSSNTEWGYKFKVTARGSPDTPLTWPFDLQLSLTKLLGRLCGATLGASPHSSKDALLSLEESAEQDVLRSELWTTLFRGGYMIGKLERSLSGKFAADDSGVELTFLWSLVNKYDDDAATRFLQRCKDQGRIMMPVGGDTIDAAVTAVFAALVWHTQQLREEIRKIALSTDETPIPDGIILAYTTADSMKMQLMSQRQKIAAEKTDNDVDDPATLCRDKALFLLKFAGLTKIQLKNEMRAKASKQWKKMSNKKSEKHNRYDAAEKYPSFRLVLDFVQDPAWTTDRVNHMLQERSRHAKAVAEVYSFAAEFLHSNASTDIFQIPVVLFLQELLSYQEGFSKHYADSLDGCGLEQEGKVRQAYYSLIRKLSNPLHKTHRQELDKRLVPAYEYIQASLLHLLDVDWQPYDLVFIDNVNLPTLYLNIAKETVKMRECSYGSEEEENEMKEYEKCMKWFDECSNSNGFDKWYKSKEKDANKDEKKAVQMFVARFCDLLDVEVSCDGCDVTLPGRRYRCLQCEDMDLCATCYVGGVKPEGEHTHDHDMVHLVYKCNKCQAFIVGTRIHCNECEDFDLCFGCHEKGVFPSEHNASHDITKFPLVKLKTSQDSDSMIQGYIHQHVWLLFTVLAMSTGDIIHPEQPQTVMDQDYVKLAEHLQAQCMEIATHCLKQVPEDAEDSSKVVPEDTLDMRAIQSKQEEAFSIHTQERIMGLLGAMIPREKKFTNLGMKYNFTTKDFIQLLFKIARGESGHEVNTRHLAMGLLGPVLTKCELQVSDQAVDGDNSKDNSTQITGQSTIRYLFSFGADCLERCGLEWACSVSRILQSLYCSPDWKSVILHHLKTCVQNLTHEPDLHAIFALFVMAGFPEVLTIGSLVQFNHTSLDRKTGVVLKHYPDRYQTMIIEIKTRKRYTVQDEYVDCISSIPDLLDSDHLTVFVSTIKAIVTDIRSEKQLTPETVWVMSLCLKVLNKTLKSEVQYITEELVDPCFIQCLVYIASKGTEFSQQWLLKDLEVLSLMLYTNEGSSSSYKKGKSTSYSEQLAKALEKHSKATKEQRNTSESGTTEDENVASDKYDSDTSSLPFSDSDSEAMGMSSMTDINKVFEDLDEKTKVMFETLHNDLKLPLDVLRAIYDMNDKNPDDVVKAIVENLQRSVTDKDGIKDNIKRLSQKWESIVHAKTPEALTTAASDKIIDTGIHYHPVISETNRSLDKASEEEWVENQKLIQIPDNDLEDDIQKSLRSKSAELLKQELEKQGRKSSREFIYKVNMAMSVLYARQVLTSLLAHWPVCGPDINAELLGCKDVQQIPCVLDLLNKFESRSRFQMVVDKVVHHCERENLIPVASTAGQFMEEVTLSSITKESPHDYKEDAAVKEKVQLPGASCLRISFDNKCCLKGSNDTLIFSSSSDMQQNIHEFSVETSSNWGSFQVPGDTVYYEFTCTAHKDGKSAWGYKFTVTAGTRDSFETGYAILNKVLSTDLAMSLPLRELWEILVYVATKQTGQQRLKAIQLLLKILHNQFSLSPETQMNLDLGLLRPLWILYNNTTKQEVDSTTLVTPVTRALTELFLQVESLAMERGIVTDYLLAIQDTDEIRKIVGQGIMNVAAIGVMINYQNLATELITLVKKKKASET